MTVGRICSRTTHLAHPDENVQVAAARMKKENTGTLVVLDPARKPVGIVTDRDLALRVLAAGLDCRRATVGEVMTANPRSVHEGTPIEDAVAAMRDLGVRRIVVVDGEDRLVGILSIDDVLELVAGELGNLGRILGQSRPGITVPVTAPVRRAPGRVEVAATSGLERASGDPEC